MYCWPRAWRQKSESVSRARPDGDAERTARAKDRQLAYPARHHTILELSRELAPRVRNLLTGEHKTRSPVLTP